MIFLSILTTFNHNIYFFFFKQIYSPPAPPEETIPKWEVYAILGASAASVVIVLIIIGIVLFKRGGQWQLRWDNASNNLEVPAPGTQPQPRPSSQQPAAATTNLIDLCFFLFFS